MLQRCKAVVWLLGVLLGVSLVSCGRPERRTEANQESSEGKFQLTARLQDSHSTLLEFCLTSSADVSLPTARLPWVSDNAIDFSFSRVDPDVAIEVGSRQVIDWDLKQMTALPAGKPVCGNVDLSHRVRDLASERRQSPVLVAWAYSLPPPGTNSGPTATTWATGSLVLEKLNK